jgi:hypothetical protein
VLRTEFEQEDVGRPGRTRRVGVGVFLCAVGRVSVSVTRRMPRIRHDMRRNTLRYSALRGLDAAIFLDALLKLRIGV